MIKWEYKIIQITETIPAAVEGFLNDCGEDGWELVTTLPRHDVWVTGYFKRLCRQSEAEALRERLKLAMISKFPELTDDFSQEARELWFKAYHNIFNDLLAERFNGTNGTTPKE